eukprot:bmy_21509T0
MDNHTTVSTFLLWGFSSFPDLQDLSFMMIFFSHVTILVANVSIMVAIKLNHNLHTPVYFFLCGLSFSETRTTMVIIPRMLVDLLSESKTISLPEHATQMFFFFGLGANNCLLLAAMSYDHYTAIHNLLHYTILMTQKICFQLMTASCVSGIVVSLYEDAICQGRYKAFSTCSFHLTVVCIHYGFAGFVCLRPKDSDSFREDMLMAVTYTSIDKVEKVEYFQ